jgi:cob(I)alamin adenosyltransferase
MTNEIDHSLNGCQRDIYELRREIRNMRQLHAEAIARRDAIIDQYQAAVAALRAGVKV